MKLKKYIIALLIIFALTINACSQKVPEPGAAFMVHPKDL